MADRDSRSKSYRIGREMKKTFGDEAKTVKVDMKFREVVNTFIRKIEHARKKSEKSKLVFPK